jgi:hypothetical protein
LTVFVGDCAGGSGEKGAEAEKRRLTAQKCVGVRVGLLEDLEALDVDFAVGNGYYTTCVLAVNVGEGAGLD